MNSNNPRIEWIDMAKGYGIILVLVGHSYIPIITPYLYTFHMPLFFFLSGFVFSIKNDFMSFLSNKIRKIIVPYFSLGIPIAIANIFIEYGVFFGRDNLKTEITCFIIQERYTTLWFLACLFVLNLLFYPIVKYVNVKKQYVVVLAVTIIGSLLWRFDIIVLPWNCDISFVTLPFMFIGYRIKVSCLYKKLNHFNWYACLFLFILTGLLGCANYFCTGERIDLFYSQFKIEPLSYITAFVGIAATIILSMKTNNIAIKYIGQNSILYFAWHQAIIFPILERLYRVLNIFQANILSGYAWILYAIITIILTILIATMVNELILHSKFRFIIGK